MERNTGPQNGPELQSVTRAAAVLFSFTAETPELGLTQLASVAGLSKPTVHRVAHTLLTLGLLEQNDETRAYRLGVRLLELAHVVESSLDVRTEARAALRELRDATGETVYLMLRRGNQAFCAERFEGSHAMRSLSTPPGTFVPLGVGAAGTAILSTMDPAAAMTSAGDIRGDLGNRVDFARANGYAFTRGDITDGVGAIAVPLQDQHGIAVGAISLGGLLARVEASEKEIVAAVQRAADAVSRAMGWSTP